MARKMVFLFVAPLSTRYSFRPLKRDRSVGEKILLKEAVKDWESEGGNLAPRVPSASR
jgi:hypothetical protein